MKKNFSLMVMLLTLVTISVCLSSCGGGGSSKASDLLRVEEEYYGSLGVSKKAKVKNISDRTLDGSFDVKVRLKDGTSTTNRCYVKNMEPGEIQEITIYIGGAGDTYSVESWSFVE